MDREAPRAISRLPLAPGVYRFRDAILEPAALEASGWSGQLLVRFVIRAGRLCEWSRERCDPAAATAALAATPPGWTGFARRSAGLAAALSA